MEWPCLTSIDGRESFLNVLFSILAITAALLISGCDSSSDIHLPYPLIISEEGLGAIHPHTPFDQVSTTLSGFTFEKLNLVSPNQNIVLLQMQRDKMPIAHIISDPSGKQIASIEILSPLVKNRYNQGIGDSLGISETIICQSLSCRYTQEPSLTYTISPERTIRKITYQKL